jgi:hypothetical protein
MKNFLLLLLVCSCAQIDKKDSKLSDTSHEVPAWVYSPYDGCVESQELCASGEGKTSTEADAQAKLNLASIFEVKINSELNIRTSSIQTFPWQSQVREEVQKSLTESVDQILETVQLKKHFKKDGVSYSLASLDRNKVSELLGSRIQKLDQELNALWAQKQRTNLRRIVKLSMERDKLNEKYSIVSGAPRVPKVSYDDIIKWRLTKPAAEPLALRVGQAPDWMTDKIKELLTEAGFKLVKGDSPKALTVQVDSIKEFLNVEGFEKYTFTLNMTSIDQGEKNKVISTSETVTGRSQADALLKVKIYFTDYIEDHLSDLHLD